MPFAAKQLYTPGNGGNAPLSKCRPMCQNFAVKSKSADAVQKGCAYTSLAPYVQGGVRSFCCSTHVLAWPLRKDETHCRFHMEEFHRFAFIHMQNAWIRDGLVDQAKRSDCTQLCCSIKKTIGCIYRMRKWIPSRARFRIQLDSVCGHVDRIGTVETSNPIIPFCHLKKQCVATILQHGCKFWGDNVLINSRHRRDRCHRKTYKCMIFEVVEEFFKLSV